MLVLVEADDATTVGVVALDEQQQQQQRMEYVQTVSGLREAGSASCRPKNRY